MWLRSAREYSPDPNLEILSLACLLLCGRAASPGAASQFTASRARFVDHRIPDTFGFQNEFNGLADCTVPGQCFRRVVRCLFDLWNCIAHRHGEANAAHYGKIRKIIAYIGDNRI